MDGQTSIAPIWEAAFAENLKPVSGLVAASYDQNYSVKITVNV